MDKKTGKPRLRLGGRSVTQELYDEAKLSLVEVADVTISDALALS
jgi:hypothetical protein